MKNEKFIELVILLEEREFEYEIRNNEFYMILGNQEFEFSKFDKFKTIELIDIIKNW